MEREQSSGGLVQNAGFKRGLRRGSIAMAIGMVAAMLSWGLSIAVFGTASLGASIVVYLLAFGSSYPAVVLAERQAENE